MNFNKLKNTISNKKITIKHLAERINVSEIGLHKMIKNKSMKVEILEEIAKVLDVPMSYFFEDNNKIQINGTSQVINGSNNKQVINNKNEKIEELKKQIEYLENTIKDKNEIINLLKK